LDVYETNKYYSVLADTVNKDTRANGSSAMANVAVMGAQMKKYAYRQVQQ